MQTKLTVRVNRELIQAAKRYASQEGTTLSQLVESYLRTLAIVNDEPLTKTPVLQRLSGILPTETRLEEYQQHLAEKYG